MTEQQRADRLVRAFLESEAPERVPDGLLDRIELATRTNRPRPAWLARLEGHHVDVITGGRRTTGTPRLGLVLAVIALVAALAAVAIYVGSQKPSNVVTPVVSPAPSLNGQPSARPSAIGRIPEPGDPIPADLIGVWQVSPAEFLYIQRGPDPFCQGRFKVLQDCWVWYDASQGGIQPTADILTQVDGKIRVMSIGQQDCRNSVSTLTYTRTGDTAELRVEPGSCFTRDFPPMTLVGSPSGPASAPPLKYP
jgi:hypothetical protein